ncbi:DUF5750 family protein [Methanobacterium sp.]|uniref:DUF5750 family protein n=1 Tax=Methanobacterium sp. TaxID=2164 RepID=UPI0025F66048|nr:DUF5750 family protein [Methanobacterium sp.]
MLQLKVKIIDYGFSDSLKRYYVTYKVTGLTGEELNKLEGLLEDPITIKGNELYMNVYFEEEYYPFGTGDSKNRLEDYLAREELEMTAYLLDLLEDD